MSNSLFVTKTLLIAALLGFNQLALADWKQDCTQLSAPNMTGSACDAIQAEDSALAPFAPPAPFLAATIGDYTKLDAGTSPFPNGSPFGATSATGPSSGSSSDVLPASNGTTTNSGTTTAPSSTGSGTFQ